jgi:uncharacterized protein
MKLHADKIPSLNTVTAYDEQHIEVNALRYGYSILLMPSIAVQAWSISAFSQLGESHFQAILGQKPELVIVGTGSRQHFAHPKLYAELARAHIGVEFMDTGAACRTYNILMTEGRLVLAALIIENSVQDIPP